MSACVSTSTPAYADLIFSSSLPRRIHGPFHRRTRWRSLRNTEHVGRGGVQGQLQHIRAHADSLPFHCRAVTGLAVSAKSTRAENEQEIDGADWHAISILFSTDRRRECQAARLVAHAMRGIVYRIHRNTYSPASTLYSISVLLQSAIFPIGSNRNWLRPVDSTKTTNRGKKSAGCRH